MLAITLRTPPGERSPQVLECFFAGRTTHKRERAERTRRIRELNDAFRRTFSGDKVTMTAGVYALPDMVKAEALKKAATFDEFNADNDPHGEHDFSSFELCGRKLFWKIDYFDRTIQNGGEDPSDPEQTTRVMTVMLASEY